MEILRDQLPWLWEAAGPKAAEDAGKGVKVTMGGLRLRKKVQAKRWRKDLEMTGNKGD